MSDSPYTPAHYDVLLAQMLLSESVLASAKRNLQASFFRNKEVKGHDYQGWLFIIITKYSDRLGKVPDDAVIIVEINKLLDLFIKNEEKKKEGLSLIDTFLSFKTKVDGHSEPLAHEIINWMHEKCVFIPTATDAVKTALAADKLQGLAERLSTLEREHRTVNSSSSISGIVTLPSAEDGQRMTIGLPWLDAKFIDGKGPVKGCAIGIIAPQMNGKTTFGIEICVSQALMQRHSMLALVEEGLTRAVKRRIKVAATGIPKTIFERCNDDLEQAILDSKMDPEIIRAKITAVDKYLHVLDMTEVGTFETIKIEVEKLANIQCLPQYIYIDWAGILAARIMQDNAKLQKEQVLKGISYASMSLAQKYDINVVISQQMAVKAVKGGPFKIHDQTCAADCGGFTEPFKYAFVINPRDSKTNNNMMTVVKARDDNDLGSMRTVIKLNPDLCRFMDMSNEWEIAGKRFAPIGQRVTNHVPKE